MTSAQELVGVLEYMDEGHSKTTMAVAFVQQHKSSQIAAKSSDDFIIKLRLSRKFG